MAVSYEADLSKVANREDVESHIARANNAKLSSPERQESMSWLTGAAKVQESLGRKSIAKYIRLKIHEARQA